MQNELTPGQSFKSKLGITYRVGAIESTKDGQFNIGWDAYQMVDGAARFFDAGVCATVADFVAMRAVLRGT